MKEYKNVFYFYYINAIGGVETMFYQLAKKYAKYDITVLYSGGDEEQIKRLKKYVRVKRYNGEHIKCEKIFLNYNINLIDVVDAKEYYEIIHADYKAMKITPATHPKITKYLGVSQVACDSFTEITGLPCELMYNPFTPEQPQKVLTLISATRLTKEKGFQRMKKLAKALDDAGVLYNWFIFTNKPQKIDSPNVIFKEQVLNIDDYISNADYLVQLSDTESYCYSIVQALSYGVPVIVTKMPVLKEIKVDESNSIQLDFDMDNIPVEKIRKKDFHFKYTPIQDQWNTILDLTVSDYPEERNSLYKVQARGVYEDYHCTDKELGYIPKEGETWLVDKDRLDILTGENKKGIIYVDMIEKFPKESNK